MPRYLTLVKLDESFPWGEPPQALMDAIGEQIDAAAKDGTLVDAQGLLPTSAGAVASLVDGRITIVDGPFTEAKEVVGGWSIFQLRNREEAVEKACEFLQAHADHWPGCAVTVEVRELVEQPS